MSRAAAGRIRAARLAAGLSTQKVADKAGVSRSTLANWENGRGDAMTVVALMSIAVALDVPVTDLLDVDSDTALRAYRRGYRDGVHAASAAVNAVPTP